MMLIVIDGGGGCDVDSDNMFDAEPLQCRVLVSSLLLTTFFIFSVASPKFVNKVSRSSLGSVPLLTLIMN